MVLGEIDEPCGPKFTPPLSTVFESNRDIRAFAGVNARFDPEDPPLRVHTTAPIVGLAIGVPTGGIVNIPFPKHRFIKCRCFHDTKCTRGPRKVNEIGKIFVEVPEKCRMRARRLRPPEGMHEEMPWI